MAINIKRIERAIKKMAKQGDYEPSLLIGITVDEMLMDYENNGNNVNWDLYNIDELSTTITEELI